MIEKGTDEGWGEAEGRKCCFAVITSVSKFMITRVRTLCGLDLLSFLLKNDLENISKEDIDGPRSIAQLNLAINTESPMQTNSARPD